MKKILILFLAVIVGAGIFFYLRNRVDEVPEYDISQMTKEFSGPGQDLAAKPKIDFADLLVSIDKEELIECDYKVIDDDTKQGLKAKVYIKGEKYKSITWKSDDREYSIFDGDTFYVWSARTKQGYKMGSSCANVFGNFVVEGEGDGDFDLDTFKTSKELFDEGASMNCMETEYVDLSIPGEIEFVDQCELLKKQKELIEKMK